jgi:hypothetical protein
VDSPGGNYPDSQSTDSDKFFVHRHREQLFLRKSSLARITGRSHFGPGWDMSKLYEL